MQPTSQLLDCCKGAVPIEFQFLAKPLRPNEEVAFPILQPRSCTSEVVCSNFQVFDHVPPRFSGRHVTNSVQNAYHRHSKRVLG